MHWALTRINPSQVQAQRSEIDEQSVIFERAVEPEDEIVVPATPPPHHDGGGDAAYNEGDTDGDSVSEQDG